jgi:hypothetical protein
MRQGEHTFLSRDSATLVVRCEQWYMSGLAGVSVGLFKRVHVFKAVLAGQGQVTVQLEKRFKVRRSTKINKQNTTKQGSHD